MRGRDAAHDQGIVHRDLKPANTKLRPTGGTRPRWGRTSSELLYQTADRLIMSAAVRLDPTLSADSPQKLFPLEVGAVFTNSRFDYDTARARFLVPRIIGEERVDTPITVVMNWWTEFVKKPN